MDDPDDTSKKLTIPSLSNVTNAYGANVTEAWIAIQINDLSEFAGCKDKLEPLHISQVARIIMMKYGYFKLTELMYFFFEFKAGTFGRFYGSVDALVITEALVKFRQMRVSILDRIEKENKVAKESNAIPYEEYLSLKNK